jgi:glycosyltransferase involved in cell wall biosynthesis
MKKLKIGLISTYTNSTPPRAYGGECYYWNLAKGLAEKGHEVHLFATGGSLTPPNGKLYLIPSSPGGMLDPNLEKWIVDKYKDVLMSMDIVHDCSLSHIPAEMLRHIYGKKEIINTINGSTYGMPRPPFNVVTGSKFWQEDAKTVGNLETEMIYWGTDTKLYTPDYEKEDYLLWIARFHPAKGLDVALDLAEYLGFKLKVAGSLQFKDHAIYGKEYIKRIKSLKNVEYVPLPDDSTHHAVKMKLMQKARAFLYPVNYKECFGMVVTEAMACGTPVIAFPHGAMPELIDDNVNGWICNTKGEMAEIITKKLPYCEDNRRHHEGFDVWKAAREKADKFDVSFAVDAYEKLYHQVIRGKSWGYNQNTVQPFYKGES